VPRAYERFFTPQSHRGAIASAGASSAQGDRANAGLFEWFRRMPIRDRALVPIGLIRLCVRNEVLRLGPWPGDRGQGRPHGPRVYLEGRWLTTP